MAIAVAAVIGTRPDAIKMAPIVDLLRRDRERFHVEVIATAQHREMLDQVLSLFDIRLDHDLDIMRPGQSLGEITTRALAGLEAAIADTRPDLVLAAGDTTTVFCAALAAFYARAAFGHVEAGLRTGDKYRPYPEEINRKLASALADLHFAPTRGARQNLLAEGVAPAAIFVTGNSVIDALQSVAGKAEPADEPTLRWLDAEGGRLVLMTAHRRENWGEPLREICRAVRELVERFADVRVVYAVHRNPLVGEVADAELGATGQVRLIEPPDYGAFVALMKRAHLILTDSGGIQEEAPSLSVPVLVLRDVTERPEGVAAGALQVVGTDRKAIVAAASRLLTDPAAHAAMARAVNPYGDGRAAERIRQAILHHFGELETRPLDFGDDTDG
jgi:UDP-N-acetylglucosamine 2-epimerase (non-hydrolysing)